MKNKKFLSVLLCLALLASLPVLPGGAAAADDPADNGMKISKTATDNRDGTYTITLEAYATGSQVTTTVNKDIPTDIVLVVDQSGSMKDPIGGETYTEYQTEGYYSRNYHNDEYYPLRHNGGSENLWYRLSEDEYVAVSVVQEPDYKDISGWRNTDYYNNQSNLYCLIDGKYKTVTVEYNISGWTINYTYKVEGQQILKESGYDSIPDFGQYAPLYQSVKKYTYSYTLNGATTFIEESFEDGSSPNTQFYKKDYSSNAGGTRLNALKNAATTFANAVAAKAAGEDGIAGNEDDVKHRIAVVGYASRKDSQKKWQNTEVFVGANQYNYSNNASQYYGSAFQDMRTSAGKANIAASIGAFDADGATYTNYGLEMANGILNASPVPNGETRSRVIILFTDGYPGQNADNFDRSAANAALAQATTAKNGGVTLYAVGIFSGADATTAGDYEGSNTDAANWFMQQVSSNNGTPRTPSYYLSADNAASLNNIFQQISDQIQTGGSSTTLGSETVVKDIISPYFTLPAGTTASGIQIDTYACTGKNGDTYTWSSTSGGNGGASATVNGDQVSVTGFNFSENWCGTETVDGNATYRGKKLVISFKVVPKDGFLGGNDVITNASAGIYENGSAQTPVMTFEQPTVNVPIQNVTVTAQDKNVYLLGEVTAEQLKNGATVKVGDVALNLGESNYGLADWQTEYVNITVVVKDAAGNVVDDKIANLDNDTTYTIEVTVAPKNPGTTTPEKGTAATAKSDNDEGAINVFKPELTFKDSKVEYKKSVLNGTAYTTLDEYFEATNRVGTDKKVVWKHEGNTLPEGQKMTGEEPTLTLAYEYAASDIDSSNVVQAITDIPVKVEAKIGTTDVTGNTTFVHQPCTPDCGWTNPTTPGNPVFRLHVINVVGDLTITKNGLNVGTYAGTEDQESAIFKVTGNGVDMTVVVNCEGNSSTGSVTIANLPAGTYTVTEVSGWTWRYTADEATKTATVEGGKLDNSVEFNNTQTNDKWLGGDNYANNVFAGSNTPATD